MVEANQIIFLTNMKLIYQHGVAHSKNKSKLSRLLAIHNCHYVAEQIVRERCKHMTFNGAFNDALHNLNFEEIIGRLNRRQNVKDFDRLLELNKIRNNAEHYFIIPDVETVVFYARIVGDFLKWSYSLYFQVNYESLAFEDLIYDYGIKGAMLDAKAFLKKNDLPNASGKMYEALGAFKFMWFSFLTDVRLEKIQSENISLADALAEFAFRIILSEDYATLEKFLLIKTELIKENDKVVGVRSIYPTPAFRDRDEASQHYDEILNIILTYQDRVPNFVWRKEPPAG